MVTEIAGNLFTGCIHMLNNRLKFRALVKVFFAVPATKFAIVGFCDTQLIIILDILDGLEKIVI